MKKTFLSLVTLSLFSLISLTTNAQFDPPIQSQVDKLMPKPMPASPNVASLGKFGEYKVNFFTGLPEINIPIFEVQSGNLKLPISLNYHASGIKMKDVASWVGGGWSLSAGGQIARRVNGKDDEQHYATTPLTPGISVCNNYYYTREIALGNSDTEPDLYSYSYPGKSGKFLGSPPGESPYLIPYEPISINPAGSYKFEITDENGVLYTFGQNSSGQNAIEGSYTSAGSLQTSATTAWYLMEMTAPNSNDKISLTYQSVGTATYADINNVIAIPDLCSNSRTDRSCPVSMATETSINTSTTVGQLGVHEIKFETGKIEFIPGPNRNDQIGLKSLSSINIYSLTGGVYSLVKKVEFVYSYFRNSSNTTDLMLKLDAVNIRDNTNQIIQKYRFTYFTNSFSWNGQFARDFWGYYNGQNTNTGLIPPTTVVYQPTLSNPSTVTTSIGNANRNTASQYLTEGVLKKIDYPTGGYTEFEFEPNKYFEDNTSNTVGGLRVTKITSTSGGDSPPVVKTYKYGLNESGYGVRNFTPFQFNYYNEQYIIDQVCFARGALLVGTLTYRSRTYYSNTTYDTDAFNEAPVLYPYVTEYVGDAAGAHIGRTVYEFDNGSPSGFVNIVVPSSTKFWKDSFGWKNGRLTHKTVFDKVNNKLSETIITYSTFQSQSKFIGYGVSFFNTYLFDYCANQSCLNEVGEGTDPNEFKFAQYTQSSGALRESSVTGITYENGNVARYVLKETSTTVEPNYLQPTLTTITKNNGEYLKTVNRYPFQLAANASSAGNARGIYMLNSKRIVATPIETYTYIVRGATENMVSAHATTYRQHEGNLDYVVPDQIYFWAPSSPVIAKSSYAEMAINASNDGVTMDEDLKPRINMIRYCPEGDIQAVSKTNDAPVSYQYGYNKALPVAEVTNAQNTFYSFMQQSTNSTSITMSGPTPTVTTSRTFTVDYTGNVYLKLGVSGTPSYSTVATYGGITSGSVTLGVGACSITVVTFTNVAPGTYTINITLSTPDSGVSSLGACGEIVYPYNTTMTGGSNEFLCENFEDLTPSPQIINSDLAHTGKQYYLGDYTASFTMPNPRTYLIEYWYLDSNNTWQYISKPYTGTSMVLPEGNAIDDVRIYPTDAQMKSYTYTPGLGITSIINESGQTYHYDYDSFGRLWKVRNAKGNIEKQYSYYYKGN